MLGEHYSPSIRSAEASPDPPGKVQLVVHPAGHGAYEISKAPWCVRQECFMQAFEFEQRLVVEPDVVDLIGLQIRLGQTIPDGVLGKSLIVLATSETLLLRRGDTVAVYDQRRRRIVVKCGYAEDGGFAVFFTYQGRASPVSICLPAG